MTEFFVARNAPMITDDEPILSDINFEALKGGYKQIATRRGDKVALTLFLDPQDVPAVLATAPLLTRFKVGMVQLGDDERPINRRPAAPANVVPPKDAARSERFRHLSPADQAKGYAHMWAGDPKFWEWCGAEDADEAMEYIYGVCDVESCKEFDNPDRLEHFNRLIATRWLQDSGQLAEMRR